MALASAKIVLRTTRCKGFDFQALGDILFFPARKITCPLVLLPDGKLFSRPIVIMFSVLPRFGNAIINGESLTFCNTLFFIKSAITGAFMVK